MSTDPHDHDPHDHGPHIGAMLRVVSGWVRDEVYAGVVEDGFDDLHPAHLAMFRYPGLDGTRPSQLATELQISKQAVNQLAGHLERCGYIAREPDPVDGRARVIRLTPEGHRVQMAVLEQARAVERRIAEVLGPSGFTQLHSELEHLFRAVTSSDERAEPIPPAAT